MKFLRSDDKSIIKTLLIWQLRGLIFSPVFNSLHELARHHDVWCTFLRSYLDISGKYLAYFITKKNRNHQNESSHPSIPSSPSCFLRCSSIPACSLPRCCLPPGPVGALSMLMAKASSSTYILDLSHLSPIHSYHSNSFPFSFIV